MGKKIIFLKDTLDYDMGDVVEVRDDGDWCEHLFIRFNEYDCHSVSKSEEGIIFECVTIKCSNIECPHRKSGEERIRMAITKRNYE